MIIVGNIEPVDRIPYELRQSKERQKDAKTFTRICNEKIKIMLQDVSREIRDDEKLNYTKTKTEIKSFDLHGVMMDIIQNGSTKYNITNVTDPAQPSVPGMYF